MGKETQESRERTEAFWTTTRTDNLLLPKRTGILPSLEGPAFTHPIRRRDAQPAAAETRPYPRHLTYRLGLFSLVGLAKSQHIAPSEEDALPLLEVTSDDPLPDARARPHSAPGRQLPRSSRAGRIGRSATSSRRKRMRRSREDLKPLQASRTARADPSWFGALLFSWRKTSFTALTNRGPTAIIPPRSAGVAQR